MKNIIIATVILASAVACGTSAKIEWSGKVDAADPRDLNHREAVDHHARWAVQIKTQKDQERAHAEQQAAQQKRQAEATRTTTQVTPQPAKPAPVKTQPVPAPPKPVGDPWMETYNRLSATLPGNWHIGDKGSWGAAAPDTGNVWIARRTPLYALASVMLHESCHVRQGRVFGGYKAAVTALAPYGGLERTADACAKNMGATWINYGVDAKAFEGARLF